MVKKFGFGYWDLIVFQKFKLLGTKFPETKHGRLMRDQNTIKTFPNFIKIFLLTLNLLSNVAAIDCPENSYCAICNTDRGHCSKCGRNYFGEQIKDSIGAALPGIFSNPNPPPGSYTCKERINTINGCDEYTYQYQDIRKCSRCGAGRIMTQNKDGCHQAGYRVFCGVRCAGCWDVYKDYDLSQCLYCDVGFTGSMFPPYRDCGKGVGYNRPIEFCSFQAGDLC